LPDHTVARAGDEESDVDLLIRTGGEYRTSNFLMWESAYAELYFSPLPWPEFERRALWEACAAYGQRERRFGGAVDKIAPEGAASSR
ncbi:undecaprenyl diphosphate synthase family protein, partial [Streptococcus anginosus]|nr:undecaprenyl diphosphate synthase family protein [Streptococcus anginosus]